MNKYQVSFVIVSDLIEVEAESIIEAIVLVLTKNEFININEITKIELVE